MKRSKLKLFAFVFAVLPIAGAFAGPPQQAWEQAREQAAIHRYSTLFTAQQVTEDLATDVLIDQAIEWCQSMGITKVYLETFRSRHMVQPETIAHARDRFRQAGFLVSGCVTTTQIGKISTGWNLISCYTDAGTQRQTREIFEFTAKLFDEIMIDDFWFTDCACEECQKARASKQVAVDGRTWPVDGEEWSDYRRELMLRTSQQLVLDPVRRINPNAKVIIKYPQWYDNFQERGYDVIRQTANFDIIWVGTEIRDEDSQRWGGRGRTTAYFLQAWLEGIGGGKCGGGWYDTLGTTSGTYLSQARQTILGGARESMLFNARNLRANGSWENDNGAEDAAAFRAALPDLLDLAANVNRRNMVGMAMYKPPHSTSESERNVFEHVGMLGIPFVPCHEFPEEAPAAFFSLHALQDADFATKFVEYVKSGRPTMITDGLAKRMAEVVDLDQPNVHVLEITGDPKAAWKLTDQQLATIQAAMLKPFGLQFKAPARTALYLFDDGSWVVESFCDEPTRISVNSEAVEIEANSWAKRWF